MRMRARARGPGRLPARQLACGGRPPHLSPERIHGGGPTMKTRIAVFVALVALAPAARGDSTGKKSNAKHDAAIFINADEIKWGQAPPDLPKGGEIAVLHGDPSK